MRQVFAVAGMEGSEFRRQFEGLEWGHQEPPLWNFWQGTVCPNTRIKWKVLGYLQLRTEQTQSHSRASCGAWWPFKDTGVCGYNWKVLKTNWVHRAPPAGCLCRAGECSGSPLHLVLPETSPSVPNNIALPQSLGICLSLPFSLLPVESLYMWIVWEFLFTWVIHDCILVRLKLGN